MYDDCRFTGSLFTPGFVMRALPALLSRHHMCPDSLEAGWRNVRRGLMEFAATGGPTRVFRHVVHPFTTALGFIDVQRADSIVTREGVEDGGYVFQASDGCSLRVWAVGSEIDLDTPTKHGTAARVSPLRRANRVLRARGETACIVTNGQVATVIVCDPAGPDGQIAVSLTGQSGWSNQSDMPPSYRLGGALASPAGIAAMGDIFDAARLHQTA